MTKNNLATSTVRPAIQFDSQERDNLIKRFTSAASNESKNEYTLGVKHGLELADMSSYETIRNWVEFGLDEDWEDELNFPGYYYFKGFKHGILDLYARAEMHKKEFVPSR